MEPSGSGDATSSALARALLFVAALAFVLPLIAPAPLLDPDEGLHAAIAQEMLDRHDLVTPTFLGQPFLDKPVLFFWTEAAALHLIGPTETAVRLPPLLFGLLGALSTALLGAALCGRRAGLAAGLVYSTLLLPLALSETAVHDIALVPFINLAVLAFVRVSRGARILPWAAAAGLSLGLSILTKGLVGVAFTGIAAAALVALHRRETGRMVIAGVIALAIAAAITAPWYLAMERAHPGYLHYYFVDRHVRAVLTGTQPHAGRAWWYYLPILMGGALPWLAYLPFVRLRIKHDERLAWIWLVGGLALLSAADSKLVTYVLPVFPAVAILLAGAWLRAIEAPERGAAASMSTWTHGLLLAALPLAAMLAAHSRFEIDYSNVAWAAAAAGAVFIIAIAAFAARRRPVAGAAASYAMFLVVGIVVFRPGLADALSARGLAQTLNARGTLPPQLVVFDERVGSLVFYLDPKLRAELTPQRIQRVPASELRERFGRLPKGSVIAVRSTRVSAFEHLFAVRPKPFVHTADGDMSLYGPGCCRLTRITR
ncbi:MAG TPA: glycosyltransferase family 39 protein [Vicinamibacterales bacterium]|nr:glycosyltransferase family 39 protein [Vicinamibacterales bacterium]